MTVLKNIIKMKKAVKYYTDEEKLSLVKQYLSSGMTKQRFSQSVGVSLSSLIKWLEKFGNPDLPQIEHLMKKSAIPSTVEELQAELIKLRKEKKELEKSFEREKLRSLAFDTLIDLAESTYHIRIRKNSDAK